ncbi:MAG: VanW family protein [Firmicutes bacterium]|nr:VanW family protein [Bacillota bacterium]
MKKILTVTFALAIVFAGVFIASFTPSSYAENAVFPWNVDVEIRYKNDVFYYNLAEQISDVASEADARGFYLSSDGKKSLYGELISYGLPAEAVREYLLPNFGEIVRHFGYVEQTLQDAAVSFSADGFVYYDGRDGISLDCDELFCEMLSSKGARKTLKLPLVTVKAVTTEDLKKITVKKASFTTSYVNSSPARCHNIALAAKSLNGITVGVNETFSFNNIVGARTEENGYKISKVIMDGNYTDGVGGGVCQVSSTLYNALLLAGFIPDASRHTLVSSYVMAGFDAMVSYGAADLTFTNTTAHPVYVSAQTQGKSVTFTVYGEPNVYRIERANAEQRDSFATVEIVDKAKYPELVYVDQTKVIINGSDGVKSKSYLKYYSGDRLVEMKLIRSDSYKRVDRVIARGDLVRPDTEDLQQ